MRLLVFILTPFFLFSQKWNNRAISGDGLVGISMRFLVEGQTKYPNPYYGPEVNGLFNDSVYHFTFNVYYNKFVFAIQLAEEFLYVEKFNKNTTWKPKGFNGSFSSLIRSYWIKIGYNVIENFNLKFGLGIRNGPYKNVTNKTITAFEVAEWFDFLNPEIIYNTFQSLDRFNKLDYPVSVTYPIRVYQKFGIVPEIGYNFRHGGY